MFRKNGLTQGVRELVFGRLLSSPFTFTNWEVLLFVIFEISVGRYQLEPGNRRPTYLQLKVWGGAQGPWEELITLATAWPAPACARLEVAGRRPPAPAPPTHKDRPRA